MANDNATASKMRDQLKSQIKGLPKNSVRVKEKADELHKVNDKFWEGLF